MKNLLVAFLIFQSYYLHAQLESFPKHTDFPIWGYYSQGGYLVSPKFTIYGLIGDTIINTVNYSKIYSLRDTIPNEASIKVFYGGIRVSEKRVYYFNVFNEKEQLLYDFSVSVNDSIFLNDLGDYALVKDIDSVLINGIVHKRFHLENSNHGSGEWIENIGSTHGLLTNMIYPTDNNPPNTSLACFKYQNINYYPNYDCNCFNNYLLNASEILEKLDNNKLKIFPNPITNESIISSITIDIIVDISIFDVNGCLVQNKIINSGFFDVGKETLKPGVYFLRTGMKSGNIYSTKFIKL